MFGSCRIYLARLGAAILLRCGGGGIRKEEQGHSGGGSCHQITLVPSDFPRLIRARVMYISLRADCVTARGVLGCP